MPYVCNICNEEFTSKTTFTKHSKNKHSLPKPILKWVGGKTQIIDTLLDLFPQDIQNYHEIFLGGGSVLFGVLSKLKERINGTVYAYDINEPLIYVYKNIQSNHTELYEQLQELITDYNSADGDNIDRNPSNLTEAKKSKENYYYWIRKQYNLLSNKTSIIGSAMFIFLNKTCFRGLFRTGPNGFNVPFGHYKSPEIINEEHLEKIHILIQEVIFECCDFEISLSNVLNGDFVYLDPPYAPETTTSFVGYTDDGFSIEQHIKLFNLTKSLPTQFLMSNSNVALIKEHFSDYNTQTILCKRSINSKNPESKTTEVLIKNY
jgi:DNA adenine methylase